MFKKSSSGSHVKEFDPCLILFQPPSVFRKMAKTELYYIRRLIEGLKRFQHRTKAVFTAF